MRKLSAIFVGLLFLSAEAMAVTPDTVLESQQQYMQKYPWSILMALDPSDPTKLIPILIGPNGSFAVSILGGTLGTVDQGASGSTFDPWFTNIRNASGTELGLAASPFAVRLFDGAAAALFTTANPGFVEGTGVDGSAYTGRGLMMGGKDGAGKLSFVHTGNVGGAGEGVFVLGTGAFAIGNNDASGVMKLLDAQFGAGALLGTIGYMWDGAAADPLQGTSADGLKVNLGTNNDVTVAGVASATNQTLILNQGGISRVGAISDGTGTLLTPQRSKIEQNTTDPVTIKTAVAGTTLVVTNVTVIGDGNTDVTFKSNATAVTGDIPVTKNSGIAPGFDPTGHFRAESNEALVIQTSAAIHIAGWIKWVEVPD